MKILMINKFLYPNGGSETYMFRLGEELERQGHSVQYFGMEHEGRRVGNSAGAYTSEMDFHKGSRIAKLTYPIKTIYSAEARRKLRAVLDDFAPDVCHLNNFNYQLTPSVIEEIVRWRNETGRKCCIFYTAHDYQLLCPNHMMRNPNTGENCEKCLGGHFINCVKGRCIHGSLSRSIVGAAEGFFWSRRKAYSHIDRIICCSEFLKTKIDTNPVFRDKTIALHNFADRDTSEIKEKKEYVLYFGRYSGEKGIKTLIKACKELPEIKFVFAGSGPLAAEIKGIANIEDSGFKTGAELVDLIQGALFSVYPSEWYENCPLSVMESQICGTPVLAAAIGGIPELIKNKETGELFESGNARDLKEKIRDLYDNREKLEFYTDNCLKAAFDTAESYCNKLVLLYEDSLKGK